MKIKTDSEREDYYLEFVEGIYDRFGREGLCRLINVVDVLNEIEIKPIKYVGKNRKRKRCI